MNDSGDRPKIIIDEDWKSQVEKEREAAANQAETPDEADRTLGQLPPATFEVLMSTMATQALAALGQFPDPATGRAEVSLELAKLQIDLLAVLQEKTKGNLDKDEADMLEEALAQLRMLFVSIRQQVEAQAGR